MVETRGGGGAEIVSQAELVVAGEHSVLISVFWEPAGFFKVEKKRFLVWQRSS